MIKDWKNILILPNESILTAIQTLDKSGLRIVIVADNEQNLLGTVSDGDIRKAIINKVSLDSPVSIIMNSSPFYVKKNESKATIREIMERNNILAIPILDDKKIVNLETLITSNTIKNYENVVFVMAGGFGKRLNPLTLNCPKPMLKLNGKPILETTINNFKSCGFNNFIISTHFLPEVIKEYFKDGSFLDVCIDYVDEVDPLGTGGALGLLPDSIIDKPIIMINGDILTNLDFGKLLEYHYSNNSVATVVVRDYEHKVPYGVIESEKSIIKNIVEKPLYRYFVNAGIYVLEPDLYRSVKKQEKIDMPDLLKRYIDLGNDISIYPLHEYWTDIGSPDDFNKAKTDIDISIKKSYS